MSNTRFAKKNLTLNLDTMTALEEFYKNGGKHTVAKPTKRPKRGYTVGKYSNILKG